MQLDYFVLSSYQIVKRTRLQNAIRHCAKIQRLQRIMGTIFLRIIRFISAISCPEAKKTPCDLMRYVQLSFAHFYWNEKHFKWNITRWAYIFLAGERQLTAK